MRGVVALFLRSPVRCGASVVEDLVDALENLRVLGAVAALIERDAGQGATRFSREGLLG